MLSIYRHYVKELYIIPQAMRCAFHRRDEFEAWIRGKKRLIEHEIEKTGDEDEASQVLVSLVAEDAETGWRHGVVALVVCPV